MYEAIVIGVSAGGYEALREFLPQLPSPFPAAVVVVQHLHRLTDQSLTIFLNERTSMDVSFAEDKQQIIPGRIYLAPPNYHLLIEHGRTFALNIDEPIRYARPSVDVLFETAAEVYGDRLIGIVLTGGSTDGSKGLRAIQRAGGKTIVEDPQTARVAMMPSSALEEMKPDYIVSLRELPPILIRLTSPGSRIHGRNKGSMT